MKFSKVADFRPTIPNRLGPILFFPASVVWHSAHFLKAVLPASTSAAPAEPASIEARILRARITLGNRILPPHTGPPPAAASIAANYILGNRRASCRGKDQMP